MSWMSQVTFRAGSRDQLRSLNTLREQPYAQHQALWRFFDAPEGTPQPFLFRRVEWDSQLAIRFLMLSAEQPGRDADGWHIESKRYQPQLEVGQRFRFSVRLNPTRSERTEVQRGKRARGKRQDYVMSRLQELGIGRDQRALERQRIVHEELPEWLKGRSARCGFELLHCETERFEVCRMRKGDHDVTLSVADFSGVLGVRDVDAFTRVAQQGIGHGRSFGLGLLLLKRL